MKHITALTLVLITNIASVVTLLAITESTFMKTHHILATVVAILVLLWNTWTTIVGVEKVWPKFLT